MLINSKFTRRSFLLLGLAPTALQAAPLVNIQNGLGLFSSHEASNINRQNRHLAFFDDPEPELMEYNDNQISQTGTISLSKNLKLSLLNTNTNESRILQFTKDKPILIGKENSLNEFLKDWRTSEVKPIDVNLLSNFFEICEKCAGTNNSLQVNIHSGYRSKKTNEYLRKSSYKVAKNSMHILGKAIDFSVPSLRMSQLARAVRNHAKGGAGVYDTFVHLDSGPKRGW